MINKHQNTNYISIDLFSGCGGLSEGMVQAGFEVKIAVENDENAVKAYKMNHSKTEVIKQDIREINALDIKKMLHSDHVHLLAGCPPCQGFSSVRKLNKKRSVRDKRNSLVLEYLRMVMELKPLTIMMENVPGLIDYFLFKKVLKELDKLGYKPEVDIVDIKNYGVPQRRKRLVLVGSILGKINIVKGVDKKITVRDKIGNLEPVEFTGDPLHQIVMKHSKRIQEQIAKTPKDGGGRTDLGIEFILPCHKKKNVGFKDIYGRLRWDDYSSTITSGCLNPSKGRFLHPQENRVITPREAALLQSFPPDYKFPLDIPKSALALLIGNALPPQFSYIQCKNIKEHIDKHLG